MSKNQQLSWPLLSLLLVAQITRRVQPVQFRSLGHLRQATECLRHLTKGDLNVLDSATGARNPGTWNCNHAVVRFGGFWMLRLRAA